MHCSCPVKRHRCDLKDQKCMQARLLTANAATCFCCLQAQCVVSKRQPAMQALVTCPSGALLQHRSANTSYRPCMAATLLPRLSTAAATVRPVSHPQLSFVLCPSSLPSHAGRSVIVPSALPSGSAHLNFLEVISTGVTPATPTYLTDKGRHHSQQLEQVRSMHVLVANSVISNQAMMYVEHCEVTRCVLAAAVLPTCRACLSWLVSWPQRSTQTS
jgi:hypothetical protein